MSESLIQPRPLDRPSPPPAPQVPVEVPDPRQALNRLAEQLARSPDRRLLMEFLRLRRCL
jgi:hypothetical protein